MAISRAERRKEREPQVVSLFGAEIASSALDLLELVELAWHDCYGEPSPSDEVVADILLVSDGSLEGLIQAGHLAIVDWQDLRVVADSLRSGR